MTTENLTLLSERWLDEVVLFGTKTNIDGAIDDEWTIPAGVGDLAFMEGLIFVANIATLVANPELKAVRAMVVTAAGSAVDIIGTQRWSTVGAARLATYFSPDPLVQVKQGERIQLIWEEVDTNATAAADLSLYFKFVRVRPQIVSEQPMPLRLVR